MKKTIKKTDTADLFLNVSDDSEFLSKYSPVDKPIVSSEVAEFIENAAREFHPKTPVKLTIIGSCVDESEKPVYASAIRNYFSLKQSEVGRDIARKTIVSLIFALVGIIALIVMIVYENCFGNAVWTECIDIFAWVFLWEAVDQFFIERNGLLMKRRRLENFINMEIEYK